MKYIIILMHKNKAKGTNLMRISFLGAGNMAGAIINSIFAKNAENYDVTVYDIDKSKYEKFSHLKVNFSSDLYCAVSCSDFVLLAVKPQDIRELLSKISSLGIDLSSKVFISIAAGISTKFVCDVLSSCVAVIRVMPNTPLLCGYGATALCKNELVSSEDFDRICTLFGYSGTVSVLPEDKMNAVISVNSSSPAYVYLFAKALVQGGVLQGIDEETSKQLAYQAILGAANMLSSHAELSPDELIAMVTSKKGTTEKALMSLNESGFTEIIIEAMKKCTERAQELSHEF